MTRYTLAAWLLLVLGISLRTCGADAQDDALVRAVVMLTAHEAGLDALADADGIHATLVHGGERHGMTPTAFARAYAPRMYAGTTPRAWVLALRLDCSRPRGYPLPWYQPRAEGALSRRDACTVLVAHVRELVSGEPVCAADDWAAPYVPLGAWLEPVDCGDTRNAFARRVR